MRSMYAGMSASEAEFETAKERVLGLLFAIVLV
jgi:hypothetical protein